MISLFNSIMVIEVMKSVKVWKRSIEKEDFSRFHKQKVGSGFLTLR